jgi:hypothetical protein
MKSLLKIALLAAAFDVNACGICIDDKVAACYDHSVVERAKARGHQVAFFAIDGSLPVNAEVRSAVLRAVQRARGVHPGTARVSLENAALSFAYDPAREKPAAIEAAVEERLAARGLSLRLLRFMP